MIIDIKLIMSSKNLTKEKYDVQIEILSLINKNSHPFHKYYLKLIEDVKKKNNVF